MEIKGGLNNKSPILVLESIGTGILVLVFNLTYVSNNPGNHIMALGIAQMMNVVMFGPLTNGHCNPAVTLAVRICFPNYTLDS